VRAERGGTGCLPAAEPVPEIPAALANRTSFTDAGLNVGQVDATKDRDNKLYYVIERMCAAPGGHQQQLQSVQPGMARRGNATLRRVGPARGVPTTG
jgi:tagatose-1,6-bisphosphate aldolase non-catalytic subunit AgaZ/GatZ